MTELERALVALGNELEFPPTPNFWPRVGERLQRRRWWVTQFFLPDAIPTNFAM